MRDFYHHLVVPEDTSRSEIQNRRLTESILRHPNVPEDLMHEILLYEENERYIESAAKNPYASDFVLEMIAAQSYDPFGASEGELNRSINAALIANPATPPRIKRKRRRY